MESNSIPRNRDETHWYYQDREYHSSFWEPYDMGVCIFLNEKVRKGELKFKLNVDKDLYVFDIEKKEQTFEKDSHRKQEIRIIMTGNPPKIRRVNRLTNLITKDNNFAPVEEKENYQKKIHIKEFLENSIDEYSEIYDLINREICVPTNIYNDFKKIFESKLKISTITDFEDRIRNEINSQAEKISMDKYGKIDKHSIEIIEARKYNEHFNASKPFIAKIIYSYTVHGFVFRSINDVLRAGDISSSRLHMYFLLLQAAIALASTEFNRNIPETSIVEIKGEKYYKFYRGSKNSERTIIGEIQSSCPSTVRFFLFNEFLSTTYDLNAATSFLKRGSLKGDLVRVFYNILIPVYEAKTNPNLMCLVENFSQFESEREILLSSSNIFLIKRAGLSESIEIDEVECTIDYYEIDLLFVSNGFHKFDFIKYFALQEIDLSNNNLDYEDAERISKSLEINKTLTKLNLRRNHLRDKGVEFISKSLTINCTLEEVDLSSNEMGVEGAKYISKSLESNNTLKCIKLSSNFISSEGAKCLLKSAKAKPNLKEVFLEDNKIEHTNDMFDSISDCLENNYSLSNLHLDENNLGPTGLSGFLKLPFKNNNLKEIRLSACKLGNIGAEHISAILRSNSTLKVLDLHGNEIEEEGVNFICESLKDNKSLEEINLCVNYVRIKGAQYISNCLKVNSKLKIIRLGICEIEDEGAILICEFFGQNCNLEIIDLFGNNIKCRGAYSISECLESNYTINKIDLSNNHLLEETRNVIKRAHGERISI